MPSLTTILSTTISMLCLIFLSSFISSDSSYIRRIAAAVSSTAVSALNSITQLVSKYDSVLLGFTYNRK